MKTTLVCLVLLGFCFGGLLVSESGSGAYEADRHAREIIKACERQLPRDVHCKIIAVESE